MGYEVWTTKETYICSETLRSKSELEEKIKECQDTIADCKARIERLVYMTEPKKFYDTDENIMWQIDRDLKEIFDEYEEAIIKLTRLWQFESAWDETHDAKSGKAYLPINPLDLKKISDKVYMGGDYCDYILEDGSEMPEDWWDVYHGFVKPEDCSFADKLGYPLKPREPERDMTIGELNAIMKMELEKNGIEVNIDEL